MTGSLTAAPVTVAVITALLTSVLLLAALGGPRVIRAAAPALAAAPRTASAALILVALCWVAALVAIGPVVAWISAGPAWLPAAVAQVCGRCLSEASPFGAGAAALDLPAIVPLMLPVLGAAAVGIGLAREVRQLRRARTALAVALVPQSESVMLQGVRVRLLDDAAAHAFSLPHRDGGIVVSLGTLRALGAGELAAVLAHERAHLVQRHHLQLALLLGATRAFRWVPLIQAIREAVPHTLEIAADQAAQRETGNTALASALLKLGTVSPVPVPVPVPVPGAASAMGSVGHPGHAVLHAAASDRIRSLTGQRGTPASTALAVAAALYAVMLAGVAFVIHWPVALALLTGC